MRIALLEDDPSQLELLGHWIARGGHDVERFERGQELLKAISEEGAQAPSRSGRQGVRA